MNTLKQKAFETLRKSEGFFKTDVVYLAQNGGWLTFGQIASAILSLASALIFANFISKDIYGNYKYIISITSILGALSLTGMGPMVMQGVAQGAEGVLKDAIKTTLRWGVILIAGAIFISAYYFINQNITLAVSMLTAGVAMFFINSYSLYGNYLAGKKNFKDLTIYNVISQVAIFITTITTIILTKNVLLMVIAYFATNVVFTLFFYKLAIKKNHINNVSNNTLITYSKHLSVMGFFGALASQLDKVLIFHYLGAVNLAVYSFSMAIPDQFRGVYKNLFGVIAPKYAELSLSELRNSINKKFLQLTLITILFVILYIFFAPLIFKLLFPKYLEAVFYSQIYMLGMITVPGIGLFANYFQVKKATKTVYKITTISHTATLLITFALVYSFGLMGAVVANGTSWLVMVLIFWYYFAKDESDSAQPSTI